MTGDRGEGLWWDTGSYNGVHYHRIRLASETIFQERSDQANWGSFFLGTTEGQGVSSPRKLNVSSTKGRLKTKILCFR